MPDLFGAPAGFIAATNEQAQQTQTAARALAALAAEEEAPVDLELKRAQASHYRALAGAKGQENSDVAMLSAFEEAARNRATQVVPATQGRPADVSDLQKFSSPSGLTAPLENLYATMLEGGAPARLYAPVAKQIAEIAEKEGQAAFNQGRALNEQLEAQGRVADQIGSIARSAIASPEGYAQMRMLMTQVGGNLPAPIKGFLDRLPADWAAGKKLLEPLVQSSLKVKDGIAIQQRELELAEKAKTEATVRSRNNASAAAASARVDMLRTKNTMLKKIGGEGTPEQVAASEALTEARHKKMEAEQLKQHPYIPVEKDKVTIGKTYSLTDGRVVRAVSKNGELVLDVLSGPWKSRPAPRTGEEVRKSRRDILRDSEDDEE